MTDSAQFDLVTVGGGMCASALAIAMARAGARVLVLEKEIQFRDRVRGEALATSGAAEARLLGIVDLLLQSCAKAVPWVDKAEPAGISHEIAALNIQASELTVANGNSHDKIREIRENLFSQNLGGSRCITSVSRTCLS